MIITRDTAPIHPDDRLARWYAQRSTYLNSADMGHGGPVEEPLSAVSPETSAGPFYKINLATTSPGPLRVKPSVSPTDGRKRGTDSMTGSSPIGRDTGV